MSTIKGFEVSGTIYNSEDETARNSAQSAETSVATLISQKVYSTSEVDTGKKWIDGKPIYRVVHKIWENRSAAPGYNYSNLVLTGPLTENAETIVSSYTMNKGTGGRWAMLATTGEGGPSQAWCWLSDNTAYYNYGATVTEAYAIIEYTKSTD